MSSNDNSKHNDVGLITCHNCDPSRKEFMRLAYAKPGTYQCRKCKAVVVVKFKEKEPQ